MILLGTIDQDLLGEYLRGPPLLMEIHDRDRCVERWKNGAVFGEERRDELLGTHAFSAGESGSAVGRTVHAFLPVMKTIKLTCNES